MHNFQLYSDTFGCVDFYCLSSRLSETLMLVLTVMILPLSYLAPWISHVDSHWLVTVPRASCRIDFVYFKPFHWTFHNIWAPACATGY